MTKEQEILNYITVEFGQSKLERIALKFGEEAGELQAAIHKLDEDRSTLADLDDEAGDVLIVLSQIAALRQTTLEELRDRRFKMIKERALNR